MKSFYSMVVALLLPVSGFAQDNGAIEAVDAELFKPAVGGGIFTVDRAQILGHGKAYFGAFLNYARNPLVVFTEQNGEVFLVPVRDQSALDLMLSVGLFDRLELGFAIPAGLFMSGDDLGDIGGAGSVQGGKLGDLRLNGKVSLLPKSLDQYAEGPRLAAQIGLKLPTGEALNQSGDESFFGDTSSAFTAALLGDYETGRLTVMGNFGFRIRGENVSLQSNDVGNELLFGAGFDFQASDMVHAVAEIDALANIERGNFGSTPAEVRMGVKLGSGNIQVPLGVGLGINDSFSAPDFRLFAGMTFYRQDDPDKDLIFGKDDLCIRDAEDKDGFEDEDGCPDFDNDRDGVVDADDRCPLDFEDMDGFQDEDGCPELDNDGDGLADVNDLCPVEVGTAEMRGCPDEDRDGILGANDKCPNDAEDKDGFEDLDGCPDFDNDSDGLVDLIDLCPNQPENKDGVKDQDGCPDEVIAVIYCGRIVILDMIFFDTNQTTIKSVSLPVLEAVIKVLKDHPEVTKVRVEGNSDDVGTSEANQILSEGRANAVVAYLVLGGINANRLEARGNTESKPLEPITGLTPKELGDARDQNRRVEFFVVNGNFSSNAK